jgi:hypothetical protein
MGKKLYINLNSVNVYLIEINIYNKHIVCVIFDKYLSNRLLGWVGKGSI